MEIPDAEVYKIMKDVAAMEPAVKKIIEFFDSGILEKKIQKAVMNGVKNCPFYACG